MENREIKIIVIVALFEPKERELKNICNYIRACDFCILMDDSEYGNEEYISDYLKERAIFNYEYIWNEKNIGLCASVNKGIKLAQNMKANWILLLDEDSVLDEKDILEYKFYIKNNDTEKIACISPQYNYDRHIRKKYDGTTKIYWSNMSGMCISCNSLSSIGCFDERLFIDGLDVEWGIRAKIAGYQMLEIGNIVMEHHPAETKEIKLFGRVVFRYGWSNPIRYYYQFRSNHFMIKKYKSIVAFKWQVIKLGKVILLFDNKKEYFRMFKNAIRDCNEERWGKYQED